jgi:hypothetical protein
MVWINKDLLIHLPRPNLPPGITIPSIVVALSDLLLHGAPIDGSCTLQDRWLEKDILPHVSKKFETFFLEQQIDPTFHIQLKSLLESVSSSLMRGMVLFVKNDDYVATHRAGTIIHDICHFAIMPDQCEFEISLHFDGLIGCCPLQHHHLMLCQCQTTTSHLRASSANFDRQLEGPQTPCNKDPSASAYVTGFHQLMGLPAVPTTMGNVHGIH